MSLITVESFGRAFVAETKRRMFDESQPRVIKALSLMSESQVWMKPGEGTNSAGNLVLHLCGNVRQWVCTGLGGQPDRRERDAEFAAAAGSMSKAQLIERFNAALADARAVIDALNPGALLEKHAVQIYEESGLSILVHVVEHLSYHTGQIALLAKAMTGEDLGFYQGQNLGDRK